MRNIIVLLTIVVTNFTGLYSQTYEEVVEVDSITKSELYERSLRWFVINSKDSNTTIKLQDSDKGEVYAKISFETPIFKIRAGSNDWASALDRNILYKGKVNISAQILSKDGKYKYQIEVIDWEKIERLNKDYYAKMEKTINKQNEEIKTAIESYISNEIIKDLKKHMSTKSSFEKNDW